MGVKRSPVNNRIEARRYADVSDRYTDIMLRSGSVKRLRVCDCIKDDLVSLANTRRIRYLIAHPSEDVQTTLREFLWDPLRAWLTTRLL